MEPEPPVEPAGFDPRPLFDKCLAGKEWGRFVATDLAQFLRSRFALWCKWHAPEDQKDPISLFMQHIFDQGNEHEESYVEDSYPEATKVTFDTQVEGFLKGLQEMARGASTIHGAPLFYLVEDLYGIPDILERDDSHPSVFGTFHYRVREVKFAKNIKDQHRIQAAFYTYVLGKIQDYTPEAFTIVNGEREALEYPFHEESFLQVLDEVKKIRDGAPVSPTYGSGAWPWKGYCDREAERTRDVSLVSGVGSTMKENLVAASIRTVEDLAETTPARLKRVPGIGQTRARAYHNAATALIRGQLIRTGSVTFPQPSVEIFLDLEGSGQQRGPEGLFAIDYLIGAVVREGDQVAYRSFFAEDFDAEGKMMRTFVDWIRSLEDFVTYHWHRYEPRQLTKLLNRYDFPDSDKDWVLGSLQDLHLMTTRAFVFPTYGNGLKDIAHFLGFQWRHQDVDAMESMALYHRYVRDPDAHREDIAKILDYNEDDCRAMMVIKDWLAKSSKANQDGKGRA